mmetsp:Transcript_34029/g.69424  ORF Transcript_34029/g.69424 Transcript_34029/m.69424 type:complete len:105 (+) Transcript_34029:1-315(+)
MSVGLYVAMGISTLFSLEGEWKPATDTFILLRPLYAKLSSIYTPIIMHVGIRDHYHNTFQPPCLHQTFQSMVLHLIFTSSSNAQCNASSSCVCLRQTAHLSKRI